MDKLERYLDQVCRGIGGPMEMRRHVRQELREHLLDAVAQHQGMGLSPEAAIEKALMEFGLPEEVRSELEAAHGQRMTWIIDKAMQWKEKTMKAKWLWMTWTHLMMAFVIILSLIWISFANIFLVPKFRHLLQYNFIDFDIINEAGAKWMPDFLISESNILGNYTIWYILFTALVWSLFEWRVKSEYKTWIRLSVLGSVAVGLLILGVLIAGTMVISFELGLPPMHRLMQPFALQQVAIIDSSLLALDQSLSKNDWGEVEKQTASASDALNQLGKGPALISLTRHGERPVFSELITHLKETQQNLIDTQYAIEQKNIDRVQSALEKSRKAFEPIHQAAKKLALKAN